MKWKAKVIMDIRQALGKDDRYVADLKVFEVAKSAKYPAGVKARYVLLDTFDERALLLVDNHEPFGFHMHTKLPLEPDYREKLVTIHYQEALKIFMDRVERIIIDEKK